MGGWQQFLTAMLKVLQDANAPTAIDIVILDVTAAPAGGVAVSTRITYPDGSASSAPAVSFSNLPGIAVYSAVG